MRISRCDDCFAVANDDVLAGERLQLSGEIAGAAVLNDPGFVVSAPELAEPSVGVGQQVVTTVSSEALAGDSLFGGLAAEQKSLWRKGNHRGRRPPMWSPGEYLVIDGA